MVLRQEDISMQKGKLELLPYTTHKKSLDLYYEPKSKN